ncbi:hypothetical protein P3X46_022794 [Hevea brasiliensis]|uniref:Phytocyanin domain-containing protein n=1 Tax=Hevea brasiliensis TaxID=3981 RepID=A0ABQ9L9Y9_HEVBR|nr:cucumber peeling cupredoxin [Hevea brasiliensis]KAJ9163084.1 hypothetical protein P3X46_022794 [Hevea brasiliensis]
MAFRLDLIILVASMVGAAAAATTYTVGDTTGWRVPPNTSFYDTWVANKLFEAGDSLEFNWTSIHTVLEVTSKAEYDNCTKTSGVLQQTSPATFRLTKNGTFYYICTIGTHCDLGQKVTIKVGNGSSPSNSAPLPLTINVFSQLLSATIMYFLTAHIV